MKKWLIVTAAFFLMFGFFCFASFSQEAAIKGSESWGRNSTYSRMYNPDTVVTVSGVVDSIEHVEPFRGMSLGVHLVLKTSTDLISVHLGPVWYFNRVNMILASGDVIDVTGSKIDFDGKPAIIASMIKKNDQILNLRDANGIPVWSGGRNKY